MRPSAFAESVRPIKRFQGCLIGFRLYSQFNSQFSGWVWVTRGLLYVSLLKSFYRSATLNYQLQNYLSTCFLN